ncbi:large ribosomal subunit protein uL29m [Pantherophis guttatus]|uniref:Large ribosomal subunit protein uL29m n=1 Tax=Pantherophis guttatus TaxID=94885 RepID=A0A6P9DGL7_PANGU|nr:large ribosomal subunit protein uL29m [Pantherophis guttatus]
MALTAVCRRLSTVLRVTGASRGGAAASASRGLIGDWPKKSTEVKICPCSVLLHTSVSRNALEEFFDDPKNWGKEVKSGDSWTVEQLRGKSSDDLHKLWYVLLKERNMLLTLEQEAKRQTLTMPSPERLEKVIKSMERMDQVIQEREDALRLLQTGQENEWPGEWRYDFLGRIIWYTFREWPIPWYLNARHKKKRFYYLSNVKPFIRLRYEKLLRMKYKKEAKQRREKRLQEEALAAESQS